MNDSLPGFVVVGNVNQGKSSVVAALIEDDTVPIDNYPGTTRRSAEYVFRAEGRDLFRIVDTPGFQRARSLLAKLRPRATHAGERPAAIRAWLAESSSREEFPDEHALLEAVMSGASVLYVVDGSAPVEPSNEAEMEILRWTGQPAMALVNKVRERDFTEQWRPVLRQFFHSVREFDAHHVGFADRLALLGGFREIRPEWSRVIDVAIAAMQRDWAERAQRTATAITDLLVQALGHVERLPIAENDDESAQRARLHARYLDAQRGFERKARAVVATVYRHPGLEADDPALELLESDLFSETTWQAFGLTRMQFAAFCSLGGFVAGGGIDLLTGGFSLGAFSAFAGLGGAAVGALGWFASKQIARLGTEGGVLARGVRAAGSGRFLTEGPVRDPRYAWILLDRALAHQTLVRERSHARQDKTLEVTKVGGLVAVLPGNVRHALGRSLARLLEDLRRHGAPTGDATRDLERQLAALAAGNPR